MRLGLLNWNAAEYTDSIRWMNDLNWMHRVGWNQTVASWKQSLSDGLRAISRGGNGEWLRGIKLVSVSGREVRGGNDPPLYPAAILLFNLATGNREVAGKLVSILAASVAVFPLFCLARRVYGEKVGLYAILLYTVSPLVLRWSIRVMGEATYTLFMILCLWLFVEYFYSHRLKHLIGCLLAAAVAPLAHLPGRILIVPAVFLFAYFAVRSLIIAFRSPGRRKTLLKALGLILIMLPLVFSVWAVNEIWYSHLARNLWYENQMKGCLDSVQPRLERWIREYVLIYPYVLTYPAALFLVIGIVRSFLPFLKKSIRKVWILLFLFYLVMIFAGVVISKWWTSRYLYSLIPFSLVVAAYGLETFRVRVFRVRLSVVFLIICLLFSAGFSVHALRCSRDSFGDVKRTALFIRDRLPPGGGRVWTDETVKTGWWAKRPLRGYVTRNRHEVRPGDYVVLHSWGGTNIPRELAYLRRHFQIEITHEERAEVVPILADDILSRGANSPVVAHHRFEKQKFQALVIKILRKRGAEEEGEVSEGMTIYEGMLTQTVKQPGHDVQIWKLNPEKKRSNDIILKTAHAAAGADGAFRLVAFADTDGDGDPDKLIARSPVFRVKEAGTWSTWSFHAEEEVIFVGQQWDAPSRVYYDAGSWPHDLLGNVMHYSNSGEVPDRTVPFKITNLMISFQQNPEENHR